MIELVIFLQVVIMLGGPLFLLHINKRVGSYASEVGKVAAIGKKIDDVVNQQKMITKATEETKSEIEHLAWNKKESIKIRMGKLEQYLDLVFNSLEEMRVCVQKVQADNATSVVELPMTLIPKLTTLQMLYLPELHEINKKLTTQISQFEDIYGEFLSNKIDKDTFQNQMLDHVSKLGRTTREVTEKSEDIAKTLLISGGT